MTRTRAGILIGAVALLVIQAVSTARQVPLWRSNLTLWTQAVAVSPRNPRAWINLGVAQDVAGDTGAAIRSYQQTFLLAFDAREPIYRQREIRVAAESNLANAYVRLGYRDEARRLALTALEDRPWAGAYYTLAILDLQDGNCDAARANFVRAHTLNTGYPIQSCETALR